MRATLSPAFTSRKMKAMFTLIVECANETTKYLMNDAVPEKTSVLEMKDLYSRFSNDVIATCAFGINCNSLKDKNNEFYLRGHDVSDFGGIRGLKFLGFSYFPQLMRFFKIRLFSSDLINFFRNIVTSVMETREKNNVVRPDMIHLLMEAKKGKLKYEIDADGDEDAGFATVAESNIGTVDMSNKPSKKFLMEFI